MEGGEQSSPFFFVLDSNGDVVIKYYYDAWGNHTVSGSNTALGNRNPFRYRGYYYDQEFGLYYLQSRYYDPEVGRFISADDVSYLDPASIFGLNLYAYCGNNPVMCTDPTGKAPKWWQSILIGIGIIVAAAFIATAVTFTGGGAAAFFAAAGHAIVGGLKIAAVAGVTAGVVRAGKAAISGGSIGDVGKSILLGFSDGFFAGSIYASGNMLLSAVAYQVAGMFNNGYGWSSGKYMGGYQTPKTPGISLITHLGGVNGGRSFGIDIDIYNGLHYHTNKYGLGKKSNWIKKHHWMLAPIIIGISVGLTEGWSEW